MANGFGYESPLNRLLSITIPKFVEGQLEREHRERISEREFTYRETQDQLDRKREDESLKLATKRYDDSIIESEDDELYSRGKFQINQFNLERNLKKKNAMFSGLESTDLHPEILSLATSSRLGLETQIKDVETMMDEFPNDLYSMRELARIKNQGMLGNIEGMHQVGDKIFSDRYTTPWVKTESKRILGEIKDTNIEIKTLGGLMTDDAKLRRTKLEGDKITLRGQLADLYDKDRPFDPIAEGQKFSKGLQDQLKASGLELKDKEAGAAIASKYLQDINVFKQEYLTGPNRNNYTAAQRDSASQKLINDIIAKEKALPPKQKLGFDYSNINRLDPAGTALLAYGGYKLAKGPTVKAYNYLTGKAVQASKHIKFVTGMPAKDIISFMKSAESSGVGSIGKSMPSIERAKDLVDSLSDKPRSKAYKDAVKAFNGRIKIVAQSLKTRGIVTNIKDADLEKLLKNSDKWRLAKLKGRFTTIYPGLKRGATKWGVFRVSQEIGKAIGDPTGGIVTGIGLPAVAKKVINVYKKKGPKWLMAKLAPHVSKSIAKRIVGGAAAGSVGGPWVAAGGALAGTGFVAYDLYKFFESLDEGDSEAATAILQSAVPSDSTQAPIDSTRMRRDSTGIARSFNPNDPDSLLFQTLAR